MIFLSVGGDGMETSIDAVVVSPPERWEGGSDYVTERAIDACVLEDVRMEQTRTVDNVRTGNDQHVHDVQQETPSSVKLQDSPLVVLSTAVYLFRLSDI